MILSCWVSPESGHFITIPKRGDFVLRSLCEALRKTATSPSSAVWPVAACEEKEKEHGSEEDELLLPREKLLRYGVTC
jgi:hypothetical protein